MTPMVQPLRPRPLTEEEFYDLGNPSKRRVMSAFRNRAAKVIAFVFLRKDRNALLKDDRLCPSCGPYRFENTCSECSVLARKYS